MFRRWKKFVKLLRWGRKPYGPPIPPELGACLLLGEGGFEMDRMPTYPTHRMLCMIDYDSDDGTSDVWTMMRLCGSWVLDQYPYSIEHIVSCNDTDLSTEPYVIEYQQQGGKVIFLSKTALFAISGHGEGKLLKLIPRGEFTDGWFLKYKGYGFWRALTEDEMQLNAEQLFPRPFDMCVECHEDHSYCLFETNEDIREWAVRIKEFCEEKDAPLLFRNLEL